LGDPMQAGMSKGKKNRDNSLSRSPDNDWGVRGRQNKTRPVVKRRGIEGKGKGGVNRKCKSLCPTLVFRRRRASKGGKNREAESRCGEKPKGEFQKIGGEPPVRKSQLKGVRRGERELEKKG